MSLKSRPWKRWTHRDDRKLLDQLREKSWSTPSCYKSLSPIVKTIVTSLHFSGHSRWGLQPSEKELKKIGLEFLDWMSASKSWQALFEAWQEKSTASWSLPFSLARHYVRFLKERYPKRVPSEKSISAQKHWLELPAPGNHQLRWMVDPVLDAFTSLTQQLPAELRLSYQLHLEGLLDEEIASLLEIDLHMAHENIARAKQLLGAAVSHGEIKK